MDILEMVKGNITSSATAIHPAAELDIDGKNCYLNALAILAISDGEFSEVEKVYFKQLLNSLELPEEKLEELVDLTENPDNAIIAEFMTYFKSNDAKYHLLIDAFGLANVDGVFHEKEKEIIGYYKQNFGIKNEEAEFLEALPQIIKDSDTEKAFNLLLDNEELREKFTEILKPYDIDIVEYYVELSMILNFGTVSWKSRNVDTDWFSPAKLPVSNKQFIKFLNYLNHLAPIDVLKDGEGANESIWSGDYPILVLDDSDIKYDIKNKEFSIPPSLDNAFVKGVAPDAINHYTNFVSKVLGEEIKMLTIKFLDDSYDHFWFDANNPEIFGEYTYFSMQNIITKVFQNNIGEYSTNRSNSIIEANGTDYSAGTVFRVVKVLN